MKKINLKQTAVLLHEILNDAETSVYTEWYLMVFDIIDFKMLKPPLLVKKKAPLKNISKISFDNKTIERIIFLLFFMTHWLKQLFLTPLLILLLSLSSLLC